ncbi:MAG TPA: PAS domain S-box protein [Thermomicrobiales bacterium]|jgi:PAS domain S-box-containing protein|nr:PAS domain S-box protein [Thermomicrobiales bacterium]
MPDATTAGESGGLKGSLVDLTAILANVGDGVTVQDPTGRLVYANAGAARTLGFSSADDLLAAPLSELVGRYAIFDEDGQPVPLARLPGRRALAGETEPEMTVRFRVLATGEERWSVVRAAPVLDEAGRVRFAVNVWQDVTGHKRGELRDRALAAIVQTADDAIIGKTIEGIVTSWNPAAAQMYGYSAEEMIGQSLVRIFPPERKDELEQIMIRLRRGERIRHHETARVTRDGRRLDVSISISPLTDAGGRIVGAATIARDVTARKRTETEQRFLAEVGAVLAASLDVEPTLQTIAGLAVPTLADWCGVHLLRADGQIEPVAIAHVDPAKIAWAWELQRRFPVDPADSTGVPKVIRTGEPEFYPEITEAMIDATGLDPERLALVGRLQLSAAIVVPLTTRGRMIGAISLYWAESHRRYDETDLALATELARRAALAVDNAQLYGEARAAEARFRTIFAGAAEGILLIAEDSRILDANAATTRLLGYELDELRAIPDGADALLVDRAQAMDLPKLRREGVWHREIVVRRKDGKTVPVETHVAGLDLAEGRVFLALWHNIAERKAAERFEHQFLEELAHDLKNPLASARLQAQLLGRWAKAGQIDGPAVAAAAANVEADTGRIAQRLDELAALARRRLGNDGASSRQ